MKAIYIDGKLELSEREVQTPEPAAGQVRVRVDFVGICGSDLHYYFEGANGAFVVEEPLAPGHELSGRVDLDPSGVLAPGTPVTVHPARFGHAEPGIEDAPHLWPGGSYLGSASTHPHTQGGLSEYLVVESDMIRVLPAELPLKRAALAEPLAVALHGMTRAGDIRGKKVLVSGAGPIGLLAAAAARARGAAEVTVSDVLEQPLARATAIGADRVIRIGQDALPENAFDVVFECSGATPAISAAFVAARRRGMVVQIGMVPNEPRPVNLAPFISKELQVLGVFRFKDEIDEAVRILAETPELDAVITHVIDASESVAAFDIAKDSAASGKVVIAAWPDSGAAE
ncbi:zinc-binding dehydrogenase [Salinibacterium sp. G-O1]|uniref:zinc-binding dehydrogenase n=1 Tax=Salinibacterium sp. G-O1 TaxID=3046208 RepID=UPI0024BB44D3|nr:zinc-binding dehydrogenase [Salinibacterium sp. G-O1]MDJ0335958.1 zinc-binding dehydrogenase [Salinibacterium sp. G-O1]